MLIGLRVDGEGEIVLCDCCRLNLIMAVGRPPAEEGWRRMTAGGRPLDICNECAAAGGKPATDYPHLREPMPAEARELLRD